MPPKATSPSTEQALTCARLARDRALKSLCEILNVARAVDVDPSKHEKLSARTKRLDRLVDSFQTEQTGIIHSLVLLDRSDEYEAVDSPVTDRMEAVVDEIREISARTVRPAVPLDAPTRQPFRALPEIALPSFDGSVTKWCAFRDTFNSLVHENPDIDDMQKFHYLLQCLTGSALSVIKPIPLSASNYSVAGAALADRFENKRLLATAHLDELLAFEPIAHESLPALIAFLQVFKENVATLKLLGVDDLAGFILFHLGSRALDRTTRQLFEASICQPGIPGFDALIDFVQKRVQILDDVQVAYENDTRSAPFSVPVASKLALTVARQSDGSSTARASSASSNPKHCFICDRGEHHPYRCPEFRTYSVTRRRDYVLINKLCLSCMSATHAVNACKSKHVCAKCQQRHHTLLHVPAASEIAPALLRPGDRAGGSTDTKFSGTSSFGSTVLLATAVIRILDARGVHHGVRALLDSGSQVSAITADCASRVGLTRRECKNELVGLSRSPVTQVGGSTACSFVPRRASSPTFDCHDLIILPQITSVLPSTSIPPNVRAQYRHLQLADPRFDTPSRIDVLLGGDLYPYLMRPESTVKHTAGCPSAMDTHLGWIIMGLVTTPGGGASSPRTSSLVTSARSIDTVAHQFRSVEEPVAPAVPTTEDQLCERMDDNPGSREHLNTLQGRPKAVHTGPDQMVRVATTVVELVQLPIEP